MFSNIGALNCSRVDLSKKIRELKCNICQLLVLLGNMTLPVMEQEPYVIPEERRKTQGKKY